MSDKFKVGDRVFARLKGYPPWPARVTERVAGKESYNVAFFGTYDVGIKLKPSDVFPYETTKEKYGKPSKPKPGFLQAMDEIEKDIDIAEFCEADPGPEALEPAQSKGLHEGDSDDGGLMIDEGTPPPILEKEVKDPVPAPLKKRDSRKSISSAAGGKKEDKTEAAVPSPKPGVMDTDSGSKQPRRSIKAKRDSVSSVGGHTPTPTTPSNDPAPTPPAEVVSRSGRKIKPKRFADDEIETTVSKPEPKEPSKRKRAVSTTAAAAGSTGTPKTPVTTPITKVEKDKKEPASSATPIAPIPPPPPLEKPKLVAARTSTRRKDSQEGEPPKPTPSATTTSTKPPAPPTTLRPPPPLHPFGRRASEKIHSPASPSPVIPELIKNTNITVTRVSKDERDDNMEISEIETKKLVNDKHQKISSSSTSSTLKMKDKPIETFKLGSSLTITSVKLENGVSKKEIPGVTTSRILKRKVSPNDEQEKDEINIQSKEPDIKKMKVEMANGASVVLSVNHDKPKFMNEKQKSEWQKAAANNILQAKMELETNGIDLLQKVGKRIEEQEPDVKDFKIKNKAERVHKKILQLRMEGEIIELFGEIINCLSTTSADCDRALELLEKLAGHSVNTLALKKHPEIVNYIRKLTMYKGNKAQWKLTGALLADFDMKSALIRDKCNGIYQNFKNLFVTPTGTSFYDVFHQEVEKFKESVGDLSDHTVLGLYIDPTGVAIETTVRDQEMAEV